MFWKMDEQQLHKAKIRSRSVSASKEIMPLPIAAHGSFLLFEHLWVPPGNDGRRYFSLTDAKIEMADFEQRRMWHFTFYEIALDDSGILTVPLGGDGTFGLDGGDAEWLARHAPEIVDWIISILKRDE
jgi:hypothetical protein